MKIIKEMIAAKIKYYYQDNIEMIDEQINELALIGPSAKDTYRYQLLELNIKWNDFKIELWKAIGNMSDEDLAKY